MSPQQSIAHYKILSKLGEGGMGEVWRATDTKLNREVAIKVLPAGLAVDPDRLARFQREAQVLASLNHPNIAAIHGVEEANAFASLPSRRVFVTDSLLTICTRRETDAVLAHEVGHFRQGPGIFPPILGWAFLLVYLPCHLFIPGDGLWIESLLALLAFALMLAGVRITRRREFRADQWSAYCTQDPLALISGLGRIAKLRGVPLDWSRLEGCILTHPSLRRRALNLARHCNLPEQLTLAALEDPDSVSVVRGVPDEHYSPVVECPPEAIEFSSAKKTLHLVGTALAFPTLLLLLTFALAAGAGVLPGNRELLVFLLGLPLVLWVAAKAIERSHRRFFSRITMAVSRRLPGEPGGEMVTLIPGPDLEAADGFYAWDIGRLATRGDRLVYLGEKTSFSVPRASIAAVEPLHKRRGWGRVYGVRVRTQDGAFVFLEALRATSRRGAERIAEKWLEWVEQTATEHAANGESPGEFPPVALPAIPVRPAPDRKSLGRLLLFPILQYAIGEVLVSLLPENGWYQWAAIAAPLLYCVMLAPGLFAAQRTGPRTAAPSPAAAPSSPKPLGTNLLPSYHQEIPHCGGNDEQEQAAARDCFLRRTRNESGGTE